MNLSGDGLTALAFAIGLVVGWVLRGTMRNNDQPQGHSGTHSAEDAQRDIKLLQLLDAGKTLPAIKRYRHLTGCGLREAKLAVDAMQRLRK